jgi:hypothetical protein
MPGFWDATCPKCHRRFEWVGEYKDKPPCRCGWKEDPKEAEEVEKQLEEIRKELFGDDDEEHQEN